MASAVAYFGFHKGGPNFLWPLVLTQKGGAKPCFPIFSYGKNCFLPKRHGPTPLNTPLGVGTTGSVRSIDSQFFGAQLSANIFRNHVNIIEILTPSPTFFTVRFGDTTANVHNLLLINLFIIYLIFDSYNKLTATKYMDCMIIQINDHSFIRKL